MSIRAATRSKPAPLAIAWRWLVTDWNWPAAGLVTAVVLIALVPAWWWLGGLPVLLVVLQLPAYMIHQAEEHLGDRFRTDVNAMAGCEALSRTATFWINIIGVWGVNVISILLMITIDRAWGLLATWLTLINALVHVLSAIARRRGNPGLVTSLLLFLPLGLTALWSLRHELSASPGVNIASIAIVLAVHAGIVAWVALRRRAIRAHVRGA